MVRRRGHLQRTQEGQVVGKQQLYALLLDSAGNPILDAEGNTQVEEVGIIGGRIRTLAELIGSLPAGTNKIGTVDAELKGSNVQEATITNGQSLSTPVNIGGRLLTAIQVPSGYVANNITIQASDAINGTFVDLYDSFGSLVTLTVGGDNRVVALTSSHMQAVASVQFIRFKTATNVLANRVLKLITKG